MQTHFSAQKNNLSNKFISVVKRKTLAQCQQKSLTKNIIKRKLRDAMIFLKQPVCGCKKCLGSKEAATVLWDKEKSETLRQGCCVRGQSAVSHLPQSWHGESKTAAQNHGIDATSWLGMSFNILLVKALHWNHPAFCTLGMQEPKLLYRCYISDFSCFLALKMQSSPQLYTPSELWIAATSRALRNVREVHLRKHEGAACSLHKLPFGLKPLNFPGRQRYI